MGIVEGLSKITIVKIINNVVTLMITIIVIVIAMTLLF